jgi:Arc/MetJ-type ribon-helix-helix transcriptional regulator
MSTNQNTRIGVRVSPQLRGKMEQAVHSGRFKDFSELIRVAIEKLLEVTGTT